VRYHAFVDESARGERYLLTAVLVPTRDLASAARQVRAVFPRGNRRTHLSAENAGRRQAILKGYASLDITAHVVIARHLGRDDQPTRDACLDELVKRAVEWQVGVLVLDSRGSDRDHRDRRCIARLLRRWEDPYDLHYTHRGSRDEPLLCLPDAIGWAVGADGLWKQLVDPVVDEIIELG
jgi:hypothetical protein